MKIKKVIVVLLTITMMSCATIQTVPVKNDEGKEIYTQVEPYGILNQQNKQEGVKYKVSVGNIILSVIFAETIIIPTILCGFYLWEAK